MERPPLVATAVVFAALGAIGFLPLFGGPGYEHSLASGLVVPAAAAISTALRLSKPAPPSPLACVARALACGAWLAAVAFATALLHGLRVGICDFPSGATLFLLTAGVGGAMGGVWGAIVAEVVRGRRARRLACVLIALAGPLAGIVVSLARFFGSPMIFAYDPFFGFFSGTLYDTIVDVRPELWSYRAGSLVTIAGVLFIASCLRRDGQTLRGPAAFDSAVVARLTLGLVCAATSLVMACEGPALGHWQTSASIARALGGRVSGARCDVVYPDSVVASHAALLLRDCEQEIAADEARLGARLDGRITEFVFRDVDQKRSLTGAAHTSIAKPWRREVYVQLLGYPHPILGHEIAHVVAGAFGRGPFRIAASAGGLWPNPGLIEGIAVATSPDDDELTGAQWARAMLDLGTLPPLRNLFSIDFLGENAAKSYTVAGAFVSWVLDRWGAAVVRAWYGGASIEALTARTWSALDLEFRQSLAGLAMPPDASAYAKARFERPSVWQRRCPHVVDALNRDADQCLEDQRYARAGRLYDGALALDPNDWHARVERARVETWFGDSDRGRADLRAVAADEDAPRTWRDHADEILADDDLATGATARAARQYRTLEARTLDEDLARTLEVKALSAEAPPERLARTALVDLLLGEPGMPVEPWLGGLSLGVWAEQSKDPVAEYLTGKNLARYRLYARAVAWLDRALSNPAPVAPSIARELLRQRAVCACALGDTQRMDDVSRRVASPDSPFEKGPGGGRREWILRLLSRCRGR
ncbi:MAG TPA: hypothetical protein VGM06_25770 [Polyangiaceae bacterium]|jgi:hypothetical protein